MKYMYYVIRSNDFTIFKGIDRNGVESFESVNLGVPEDIDCLILKGKTNIFGGYPKRVTELATGEKFRIKYIKPKNKDEKAKISVYSRDLDLYFPEPIELRKSLIKPQQAKGFVNHINEDSKRRTVYVRAVNDFMDYASKQAREHEEIFVGPSEDDIQMLRHK